MARSAMTMGTGGKIAEQLSVGVLAQIYPWERVSAVLQQTNRASERIRDLPAEVVTYYVMGLVLFMAVSTREVLRVMVAGLQWLRSESSVKVASKAAISQARTRLGVEPLKRLWEQTAQPLLPTGSAGAFFGARRLMALDGTAPDGPTTYSRGT